MRTTCIGTPARVTAIVVATSVVTSATPKAPFAWCDDNESAPCPAVQRKVSVRLAESNTPRTGPAPYTYTLTASLRVQAQAPAEPSAPRVPLLLFGGAGCPAGNATGLSISTAVVRVHGQAFINSGANDPACPAMRLGTLSGYSSSGTSILTPGTCRSSGVLAGPCPAVPPYPSPMPDPYAGLAAPTGAPGSPIGCPGGHASPGTYTSALVIGASACTLDSGVFILQKGISITTGSLTSGPGGVLLYITGGTITTDLGALVNISPMTSGPYAGLLLWQVQADTTTLTMGNLALFALNGVIYAPSATVKFSNISVNLNIAGIVARSLVLANIGFIDIGK